MKRRFKGYKKKVLPRTINDSEEREKAIKHDIPARFEIRKHPNLDTGVKLWDKLRTFDGYGKRAVREHDERVQRYSKKHDVDPDLVRSVMFAENARGHKIIGNKVSDMIRKSDSPLPMNIQKERWASLIDKKPEDLYDPDNNIEASTILLKRIINRIDKPTPEKIGSIWHYTGRENTDEFGEYIGEVYKQKPWKEID